MNIKKKLYLLLLTLCLVSISACGNKESSGYSDIISTYLDNEKATDEADNNNLAKEGIGIEDIERSTGEEIVDDESYAPDEESEKDLGEEEKNDDDSKDTENEDANTNDELVDGMHPEFKEAMDSYEAFYDEYCDFMKKYAENPTDIKLLADYTDMLAKEVEMSEKFEAWESKELNNTELKYYLDVNNRITKKLLDVVE